MNKLMELKASGFCGVNDERITNVNHMNKLKELNASGFQNGISDEDIKYLNLEKLIQK
jgi:hypothetical protein